MNTTPSGRTGALLQWIAIGPIMLFAFVARAQTNVPPEITGQVPLETPQDTPIEILLDHLIVNDPDNAYPTGFTLEVQPGANYTVAGTTVTPDAGFSGDLVIPVTVSDGEASSEPFDLSVTVVAAAPVNTPPVITGQDALSTLEDTPITLRLNNLQVTDPDDNYPGGFTLNVQAGTNYTVSETTVTPDAGFTGTLSVPVTVNDGQDDSEPFNVQIMVTAGNVAPVITGQTSLSTEQETAITIQFTDLIVTDPDDNYPTGFTMTLAAGPNYSFSGRTITPDAGFTGTLSVPVTVNDGEDTSNPFTVSISVTAAPPSNVAPVITGQLALVTEEETGIRIQFSDLTVTDPDDNYPQGFTMTVSAGANYTVNNQTVTPAAGFSGVLSVPVTVNDGEASSEPFNVQITVNPRPPQNEPPVIIGQSTLAMLSGETLTIGLQHLVVTDPDDTYPSGFTLRVFPGANYTVSGTTIRAGSNFTGQLSVRVTVNDGEDDSAPFDVQVTVNPPAANVKPVITGQQEISTFTNTAFNIRLTHLVVFDPDDTYPTGFTLEVQPGTNYTVSGSTVTPASGFTGSLSVGVRVNDGEDWSDRFNLRLDVIERDELRITGQLEITVAEDSTVTIDTGDLVVNDPSGKFPAGFSVVVLPGDNYTASGATVAPATNFSGTLEVSVQVKSASATSNTFRLLVTVTPVNDIPSLTALGEGSLRYSGGGGELVLAPDAIVTDPDNEQLVFAEVYIDQGEFESGKDALTAPSSASVRSVFDPNTGILVLLGQGTLGEYQQLIRQVAYVYQNDTLPVDRSRRIHFRLNDGQSFSDVSSLTVELGEMLELDVPNVFSPNEDRANDLWVVSRQSAPDRSTVVVRVFDKRGSLVYESFSLEEGWDGRYKGENLPADTYFYTIEVKAPGNAITRKGVVTILR